jgi:hypothetical protein
MPTSPGAFVASGNAPAAGGPIRPRRHDDDRLQRLGRRLRPHLHPTPKPDGTTDIDAVVVREGKNLRGWLLGFVVGTVGKGSLTTAFRETVKAIEARNGPAGTPYAT